MKKKFGYLITIVLIFQFSCLKKDKITFSDQYAYKDILKSNTNMLSEITTQSNFDNPAFPDTYPEWGSIGQNRPKAIISQSYSPDEQNILMLAIHNPASYDPNGIPSQFFHLQYRKVNNSNYATSEWYNYHPTKQAYKNLRIDTLSGYHPSLGQWFFPVNPKLFPLSRLEFRVRLLYPPLDTSQKNCATLWSDSYDGIFDNNYGDPYWDQDHNPTEGIIVAATASINLSIHIDNLSNINIGFIKITALGQTNTYYSPTFVDLSGHLSINANLNIPRKFSYTATVTFYNTSGNKFYSASEKFYNEIYIDETMGSNPLFNFNDAMIIIIPPTEFQ